MGKKPFSLLTTKGSCPRTGRSGFTLIELMVVISIIGLLTSVALVSYQAARSKARDAKRIADMNQVEKALELYMNEYNTYPTTSSSVLLAASSTPGLAKFMSTFPVAPTPPETASGCSAANNSYMYQGTSKSFTITFCIGDSRPGSLPPGQHYMTEGGFR